MQSYSIRHSLEDHSRVKGAMQALQAEICLFRIWHTLGFQKLYGRVSPFEVKKIFNGHMCLPCASHYSKCFAFCNSLNPGERPMTEHYYYPHFRDEEPEVQRG